jgi:hypothetical protein
MDDIVSEADDGEDDFGADEPLSIFDPIQTCTFRPTQAFGSILPSSDGLNVTQFDREAATLRDEEETSDSGTESESSYDHRQRQNAAQRTIYEPGQPLFDSEEELSPLEDFVSLNAMRPDANTQVRGFFDQFAPKQTSSAPRTSTQRSRVRSTGQRPRFRRKKFRRKK